ncbi:MAG TPA: glycosyltransferase [Gemmatimonadaceae bacterium]|nr:glycosyltransferase [Gemmatimonadaceae bacterium]
MRIMLIGSDNPWRMETAVERALRRAGHTTLLIDDRRMKRLIGWRMTQLWAKWQATRFDPEFVFLSKCLALDPETVSSIIEGRRNAMWYHDPQWYRDLARPDIGHIAEIGKRCQVFFVTGFADEWRGHGLPAEFLPAAGDSGIHPVPPDHRFASDIAFIGTGYDDARAQRLMEVSQHYDLRVWGLGWEKWSDRLAYAGRPVEGEEFAAVCSSSCVTLGINPLRAARGGAYTSDRTWMVMLAGAFYLAEQTDGLAEMLREGEHCGFYRDTQSCIEQCGHYLSNPGEREDIRIAGERFVRAHHTYDQRIANILEHRPFVNPLAA